MKKIILFFAALVLAACLNAQTVSNSYVHFRSCIDQTTEYNESTDCGEFTWSLNGQKYEASGDYEYRQPRVDGCDDVHILHLTITGDKRTSENVNDKICHGSYTYVDEKYGINETLTTAGIHYLVGTNADGCKHTVTLTLADGPCAPTNAIDGLFSVSETKQVFFAKANLNYDGNYSFMENQTDCGYYFPFGYSGTTSGSRPTDGECNGQSYNLYNDGTSKGAPNLDWGVRNNTQLGGSEEHPWRTLQQAEWTYLINRTVDNKICWARATVNDVKGLILLPDNWNLTEPTVRGSSSTTSSNVYSATSTTTWSQMEANGAVFLPMAGGKDCRYKELSENGSVGYYWTADCYLPNAYGDRAYCLEFNGSSVSVILMSFSNNYKHIPVRLVQDAPAQ